MLTTFCNVELFGHIGPFSDELMVASDDSLNAAVERLQSLNPLDAVRLVIAATRRSDAVIDLEELDRLGDRLGVFADDE